jgi:hypothetical protein
MKQLFCTAVRRMLHGHCAATMAAVAALGASVSVAACGQTAPSNFDQQTSLKEAIAENTRQNNQAYPAGVPKNWSWYYGKSGRSAAALPPRGFSAVSGWGVIFPEAGRPVGSNVNVLIAGLMTYLHNVTGGWIEVQSQAKDQIGGGHFAADFSGNASTPLAEQRLPDGSVRIDAPVAGHNDHFWLSGRGTFTPETIDGVFVAAKLRKDGLNANLIGALGADWWRNSSAQFQSGFANNPGVGQSNFIRLTPAWQPIYFYSITTQQLRADPPPLQEASLPEQK